MKKIITVLAMIGTFTTNVFAAEEKLSASVLSSFNKEFYGAKEVVWTVQDNYTAAHFDYHGSRRYALYNNLGELMKVSRHIRSLDLPHYLKAGLKKEYTSYWIADLVEVSSKDAYNYYATLQSAGKKIILKSKNGSEWTLYESQKME
jgi:hypothetical protein